MYCILCLLFFSSTATSAIHTIVDSGLSFDPANLTINVGDTVIFSLATMHNAVEVTQNTWNTNGNTPNGGFSTPFGGGTVIFSTAGTYYYVCSPHAAAGMKGIITVVLTSVSTGAISPTTHCKGASVTVPFTATGAFTGGNVFTAQLSNASGSFATPTAIGTLNGTTSGQINATIPQGTPTGSGYRIRVVSSTPALVGNDNGADLTILEAPSATITAAGPTTFCDGLDVTLEANTGPGLTYVWRRNGVIITGASSSNYVASEAGLYTVEVSNGTCSTLSAAERVIVIPSDPTTLTWTGGVDDDWSTVGNWDNPCAIPTAGDTVIINPSTNTPSSIPAISLGKLTVNNSAGLTLGDDVQIQGELAIVNGHITLGNFNLLLSQSAAITGASSSSFIITNGSGELRQAGLGPGGRIGAILFPVGHSSSRYTPVQVTNGGTLDEFRVRTGNSVLEGGDSGNPLSSDVVGVTWFISEAVAGGSNATLTFQWQTMDETVSFDRTSCYIARHDGSDWIPLQPIGAASGIDPWLRSISGVTAFSPFAIGDGESPLPVVYRLLTGQAISGEVHLHWETEMEVNNAGFHVERASTDTDVWIPISFIPSAAASGAGSRYHIMDQPPAPGEWRYRLKQIDTDGSHEYSPVMTVYLHTVRPRFAIDGVYPNPFRASIDGIGFLSMTASDDEPLTITVHDMLGRVVATVFEGYPDTHRQGSMAIDMRELMPGMYVLRALQGGRSATTRVIVQP
jgi:plastocyanin